MGKKTRQTLPGYPWNGKFETMEEIRQYLGQPKLTCLLCGHPYAILTSHIHNTHDMPVDAYREKYGLPWSKALAGKEWRELKGRQLRKTRASGKIGQWPSPEHLLVMAEARARRRPAIKAAHKAAGDVLVRLERRIKIVTAPERMEEFLRRIATGRTITEVATDEDMPSFQSFYKHCSENPDFLRRLEAVWDGLPVGIQVRGYRLGLRLMNTIDALVEEGKAWLEISQIVGGDERVIRLAWHRQKSAA